MDLGLFDVHILVTGASGGIGLSTARLFLQQGACVTAHYNTTSSTLDTLVAEFPDRVRLAQANLSVEENVKKLFESADNSTFGPVVVAVANHGYYVGDDVMVVDMSLEQWQSTLNTNLTSSFLVCREYLRSLRNASDTVKSKANIILVGSTAGKFGEAAHADYAASKSALQYGFTRTIKNEIVKIAPRARVNTVAPGWTRTPMAAAALENGDIVYKALATTPLRKVATPEDIAHQIVIVASNVASGHVSGQCLMVEGGMEGRLLNERSDIVL